MKKELVHASGKRKSAIARATLRPGKGIVRVNKVLLQHVQPKLSRLKIVEVLTLTGDAKDKVDIDVNTYGGGFISQADAAALAIGKAMSEAFPEVREDILSYDRQYLVADVRRKETHKPNCHGKARAKTQKSYR